MDMAIIETHDEINSMYASTAIGGALGTRISRDRRYWCAWADASGPSSFEYHCAVMDDFGALVPVPYPETILPCG